MRSLNILYFTIIVNLDGAVVTATDNSPVLVNGQAADVLPSVPFSDSETLAIVSQVPPAHGGILT